MQTAHCVVKPDVENSVISFVISKWMLVFRPLDKGGEALGTRLGFVLIFLLEGDGAYLNKANHGFRS